MQELISFSLGSGETEVRVAYGATRVTRSPTQFSEIPFQIWEMVATVFSICSAL
jgi:hypothetical protein